VIAIGFLLPAILSCGVSPSQGTGDGLDLLLEVLVRPPVALPSVSSSSSAPTWRSVARALSTWEMVCFRFSSAAFATPVSPT
jgi:hypothetical protein